MLWVEKTSLSTHHTGAPAASERGYVQQALIGTAPEPQRDVIIRLDEPAVHQDVQQAQQLVGDFAPGVAGDGAGQLLPGVAGVAPYRFVGVQRFEVAYKGQQFPLVFRLHRLAPSRDSPEI